MQDSPPQDWPISTSLLADVWRAIIAALFALVAWVGKRAVSRSAALVERMAAVEVRLQRLEDHLGFQHEALVEIRSRLERHDERLERHDRRTGGDEDGEP